MLLFGFSWVVGLRGAHIGLRWLAVLVMMSVFFSSYGAATIGLCLVAVIVDTLFCVRALPFVYFGTNRLKICLNFILMSVAGVVVSLGCSSHAFLRLQVGCGHVFGVPALS